MSAPIESLHHVTATVDGAREDLDFCVGSLALRLVKKTVNFDNHNVFHFYYGDERGRPGTIWTTFPYRGQGLKVGTKGSGQVTATSFSVPTGTFPFWRTRLAEDEIATRELVSPFGDGVLAFDDPSGLWIELVESKLDRRRPWTAGGVGAQEAIRGLHSVTMVVRDVAPTLAFMTHRLGFRVTGAVEGRTRMALGSGGPGCIIDVIADPDAPPAVNGIGTVHHVAFAIDGADDQLRLRDELLGTGIDVTEVLDRNYFTSIYFREPGGVLFEVATKAPGFTVDETLPALGQSLRLPAWEEPNRAAIEAALPAVVVG